MRTNVKKLAVSARFILFLNIEDADANCYPESPDSL